MQWINPSKVGGGKAAGAYDEFYEPILVTGYGYRVYANFNLIHLGSNTCLNKQVVRREEPKWIEMASSRVC